MKCFVIQGSWVWVSMPIVGYHQRYPENESMISSFSRFARCLADSKSSIGLHKTAQSHMIARAPMEIPRRRRGSIDVISFGGTSISSTAGLEARIQTGALPAVGWSVFFAFYYSSWRLCFRCSSVRWRACISFVIASASAAKSAPRSGGAFNLRCISIRSC